MTLALRGSASSVTGFLTNEVSEVVRLRSIDSGPTHVADAALVQSHDQLLVAQQKGFDRAVLVGEPVDGAFGPITNLVVLPEQFSYLSDGDIIGVEPKTRRIRSLFRKSSKHNSFLVTERCNHNCLMCSQPPRDVNDQWLVREIARAIPLVDSSTRSFSFTGGEPLSDWREFTDLLSECREALPKTAVHVLTNGRAFARTEVVEAWSRVKHPELMAGIPVYASVDHIHDYVVQARNAFDETILGILKLKEREQRVEVRVVLHAITAPLIAETCRWISRNLPFVDHVALMGLENTGFALANAEALWIDPVDYAVQLAEGVDTLRHAKVPVSVYNLPRCILPRSVWSNTVQSISDWKNGFLESCSVCVERANCSGFFTTGRTRYSRAISPILARASL